MSWAIMPPSYTACPRAGLTDTWISSSAATASQQSSVPCKSTSRPTTSSPPPSLTCLAIFQTPTLSSRQCTASALRSWTPLEGSPDQPVWHRPGGRGHRCSHRQGYLCRQRSRLPGHGQRYLGGRARHLSNARPRPEISPGTRFSSGRHLGPTARHESARQDRRHPGDGDYRQSPGPPPATIRGSPSWASSATPPRASSTDLELAFLGGPSDLPSVLAPFRLPNPRPPPHPRDPLYHRQQRI